LPVTTSPSGVTNTRSVNVPPISVATLSILISSYEIYG
jgi:hypothetical protein